VALSVAAAAEVAQVSPDLHPILTLNLPGGAKRYTTTGRPVSSDSIGTINGKVRSWGQFTRSLSDPFGGLVSSQWEVEIEDLDRTLEPILEGASARAVYGSTVTLDYGSKNIPVGEWPRRYVGRIARRAQASALVWRFTFRTADDAFRTGRLPVDSISPGDFPLAEDQKIYGLPIPIVMGVQDSNDGTVAGSVGACPAYNVVRGGGIYRYLCGAGSLFHIERVFNGGTFQSATTWARKTYTMAGFGIAARSAPFVGRRMTFIEMASDPGLGAVITWDGIGLTQRGIGLDEPGLPAVSPGAYPLTNPAKQLRILLNEFVLPDIPWRDGEWASWNGSSWSDHPLLDSASFDTLITWFGARAYRGSLWLGAGFTDGLSAAQEWAASHGIALHWTAGGKLAVKPRDPSGKTVYFSAASQWWRAYEPDKNPIIREEQSDELASEMSSESFKLPTVSSARTILSVRDDRVARVSRHIPSTGKGINRSWGTSYARQMKRELLNAPTGVFFADDISGDAYDGLAIGTWNDIKQVGSHYDFTQATALNKPLLKLGAVGGRPSLVFDGANTNMAGTTINNLFSASELQISAAIKVTANGGGNNDANATLNPAIFADAGGDVGLYVQFTGGQNYLQFGVNDGALNVAKVAISLNTWYVWTGTLSGGKIYSAVNLFSSASTACGNVFSLGNIMRLGANPGVTALAAFEMLAIVFQNAEGANQGNTTAVFPGGWNYMMAEMLGDIIRLPESQWL
jgi:hypothetical protein